MLYHYHYFGKVWHGSVAALGESKVTSFIIAKFYRQLIIKNIKTPAVHVMFCLSIRGQTNLFHIIECEKMLPHSALSKDSYP